MIHRLLSFIYVMTLPFVSAFTFTSTITLSVLTSAFMFVYSIFSLAMFRTSFKKNIFNFTNIFLLLLYFVIILSYFYNAGFNNDKATNHLIAYTTTFIGFYFSTYVFFTLKPADILLNINNLLLHITLMMVFCSIFTISEFLMINLFNFDINSYIPRVIRPEYDIISDGLYRRARGFAEESGHFAFFIEIFAPITIYYLFASNQCKWNIIIKVSILVMIILTALTTISAALFIVFGISIPLAFLFHWRLLINNYGKILLGTIFTIVCFVGLNSFFPMSEWYLLMTVTSKLSNSGSMDDRTLRIEIFEKIFNSASIDNLLIGFGPAAYVTKSLSESIVQLFFNLTLESGLIGLSLFSAFCIGIMYNLSLIKDKIKIYLFFSMSMAVMHYFIISNYWFPWFWLLCVIISLISHYKLKITKNVA